MIPTKRQIVEVIENLAPAGFQEDYDNSGLQAGILDEPVSGVLVCLDITEAVIDEALRKGCNMVVSHHPLLFQPLKQVSDLTYQQRCVLSAIRNGVTLYSAHTNLDNAEGGVNHRIASIIGLDKLEWLEEKPSVNGHAGGSGLIGELPSYEDADSFLHRLKEAFGVECLMHSALTCSHVKRIAVCGGAGSFLMEAARARGADCFITGEISYHHFFDAGDMLLVAMGHYQSERFTMNLISDLLRAHFPSMKLEITSIDTNPIHYKI